jgi:hypothetical protein
VRAVIPTRVITSLRMWVFSVLTIVLSPALGSAAEDMPPVGRIVVFGDLRFERAVRQLLPPVPISFGEADVDKFRKKLAASRSWRQSDLTWVCCESTGTAILYVGVRATDRHPRFRPTPTGAIRLDSEDLALYDRLMDVNQEAVFKAIPRSEDDSAGHALSSYPPEREVQEKVIARVGERLALWRDVALESGERHHRAAAVHLIAYGPKDQMLADLLTRAAQDPDSLVRNNAIRAIGVLARSVDARTHLRIDPTPLMNIFESVHWTDWNKASFALLALTDIGDPKLLAAIARQARNPLRQIASWPPMHATPGVVILERIGTRNTRGPRRSEAHR